MKRFIMRQSPLYALLLLFLWAFPASGSPPLCEPFIAKTEGATGCLECQKASQDSGIKQAKRISRVLLSRQKNDPKAMSQALVKTYADEKAKWQSILDQINGKQKVSKKRHQTDWVAKLQSEFGFLIEADHKIKVTQEQHKICLTNCSSERALELEKDIEGLRKIKTAILAKNPIFLNKAFEAWLAKNVEAMKDPQISDSDFKSLLSIGVQENLISLNQKIEKANDFVQKQSADPEIKKWVASEVLFPQKFPSHYEPIADDLLTLAVSQWESLKDSERSLYCQTWAELDHMRETQKRNEDTVKGIASVGLLLGSVMVPGGPVTGKVAAPVVSKALQAGVGAGLREVGAASLAAAEGVTLARSQIECTRKLSDVQLSPSVSGAKAIETCREEVADQLLETAVAGGTAGSLGLVKHLNAVRGFRSLKIGELNAAPIKDLSTRGAFTVRTAGGKDEYVTAIDLSKVAPKDKAAMESLFWDYLQFYKEQLKITMNKFGRRDPTLMMPPKELDKLIETAWEMRDRTVFAIKTKGAPFSERRDFLAGIGHVRSGNKNELLPSTADAQVELPRTQGRGIEVGRLSVDLTLDEVTRKQALQDLVSVYRPILGRDKEYGSMSLRTSVKHESYYSKVFGKMVKKDRNINDRDVVFRITPYTWEALAH